MLGHFKIKSYICGKDSANRAQYKTNLFVFNTEMKPILFKYKYNSLYEHEYHKHSVCPNGHNPSSA